MGADFSVYVYNSGIITPENQFFNLFVQLLLHRIPGIAQTGSLLGLPSQSCATVIFLAEIYYHEM